MFAFFLILAILNTCNGADQGHHHQSGDHVHHATLQDAATAAFTGLDTNDDDLLEPFEFQSVFNDLDTDGDGQLSLAEFYNASYSFVGQYTEALFHYYDTGNTGFIHLSDIHNKYDTFDQNHNHEITRNEFIHVYTKILEELINHHGSHITGGN